MISRTEDLWYLEPAILGGSRVLGVFQQALSEGLVRHTQLVAQDARQKPCDGVDEHHRRELPSGQNVVAYRDLEIGEREHPLVEPLISPAHKDDACRVGQLPGKLLRESLACRGQKAHNARVGVEACVWNRWPRRWVPASSPCPAPRRRAHRRWCDGGRESTPSGRGGAVRGGPSHVPGRRSMPTSARRTSRGRW